MKEEHETRILSSLEHVHQESQGPRSPRHYPLRSFHCKKSRSVSRKTAALLQSVDACWLRCAGAELWHGGDGQLACAVISVLCPGGRTWSDERPRFRRTQIRGGACGSGAGDGGVHASCHRILKIK